MHLSNERACPIDILYTKEHESVDAAIRRERQLKRLERCGRRHVGPNIKLWNGDSRGRWEGNTLVVETRNLNGYTWLDDAGDFYTDAAHLIERLTMVDRDTIHYQVTIDDPTVYTRPWTMAWALVRETNSRFQLLEEACVEGDRDLPHFLEAGRKFYFGKSWKSSAGRRER
jgi:hypothetical protein